MGRISTYVTDTEINDGDRLLGSEAASNVTKNYSVLSVGEYFRDTGIIGGGVQLVYKFQEDALEFRKGEFMLSTAGGVGVAMSNVTAITINKTELSGFDIEVLLRQMFDYNIAIYGADVKNTFGEYTTGAVTEDNNSLTVALTSIASNGSLVDANRYYISKIPAETVPIKNGADIVEALNTVTPIVLNSSRVETRGITITKEGVSYTFPDPDENANAGQGYILYTDATGNLNWKEFPLDQVNGVFFADPGTFQTP
jgi:hypothetical protein